MRFSVTWRDSVWLEHFRLEPRMECHARAGIDPDAWALYSLGNGDYIEICAYDTSNTKQGIVLCRTRWQRSLKELPKINAWKGTGLPRRQVLARPLTLPRRRKGERKTPATGELGPLRLQVATGADGLASRSMTLDGLLREGKEEKKNAKAKSSKDRGPFWVMEPVFSSSFRTRETGRQAPAKDA